MEIQSTIKLTSQDVCDIICKEIHVRLKEQDVNLIPRKVIFTMTNNVLSATVEVVKL